MFGIIGDSEIERLSWEVEDGGLGGHERAVERIVDRARRACVSPVLIDVLADRHEPECARVRAFGRIAVQLGSPRPCAERLAA